MDIFAFIYTPDPTKVRVVERERNEASWKQVLIGFLIRVVVATKQNKGIPQEPRRQRKRKSVIVDAGGVSHPPKKLREDHETSSRTSIGGKSRSVLQRLLARAVLNAEVGVASIPTLPFVTESVSTMPEREDGDHIDFVAELNLRTIGTPQRFIISSDSSRQSATNVAEVVVDSLVKSFVSIMTTVTTITSIVNPTLVTKEKLAEPFPFGVGSSSAGGTEPTTGVFSDLTGSDFLVGFIRTVINHDTDLQKMVDEFAHPKFFASVRGMEHDQLFTEFYVGATRQIYLSAKVRMRAEYNVKEKRRLKSVVERQGELLTVREEEIENLKAHMLLREAKAVEAIRLRAEASNFEVIEKSLWDETNALRERNAILEKERNALDVKLQNVNFPLLAELKSNKDASIKTVMDILRLEELLVDKLGLDELQPNVDQLMVLIHRSLDKVVISATALSLALDVSSIRVRNIKENISNHISTLRDVFVPLAEPFFVAALTDTHDDYEVIGVDDLEIADGDAPFFPNVDDAKLNTPQ
nr:hypothetical protein [Tanacetum cinerariifolium]